MTIQNKQIIKFIKQHTSKSGIIYCLSRKKVEELAAILQANDIKQLTYHAGLDSETRSKTQDDFLMEELDIIVATIAFGMGIDKPDVRFVIHYDIPKSLEAIIKKQDEQGAMARKVSVLCSILRKTLINWRSLWRGSLLQNKISVVSCY